MTSDDIINEIKKANNIVILTHEVPDGDAIGSSLALYLMIKSLKKDVDVIIPEYPRTFNFLPDMDKVKKESKINYDLAISVDCSDIKRLNGFSKYFEDATIKIVIDHHSVNTMFGDYNYVNPASPACAEILATLCEYWGIEITKEIGTCLLTGIITDTGGLRYPGVTSETYEFVARLMKNGINISNIYRQSLQIVSKTRFELTNIALNRMEFIHNGKIAFTYVTEEDNKKVGIENGDHEGIVSYGRDIEGVEVSLFLRETVKGWKCSLRSNDYVNVSDVCLMFNGGGHIRAAGCVIQGTLKEAKEKVIKEIEKQIKDI